MDNLTVPELFEQAFHFYSHNSSYAIPGFYDVNHDDASWILGSALTFFTMQTGLAVIEVGTVRKKNQMNVIMRNLADFMAGGMAFWVYAFGFMYGRGIFTNPFFGVGDFFLDLVNNDPLAAQVFSHYIFQIGYASTTTTIISGAIAERVRFTAYLLWAFLSMIIYGIGGGWIWGQHGFLRNMGAIDFSGGGPIHLIGGAAAIVAAWYIGPRIGRYDKGTKPFPPSGPFYVVLGMLFLWWGWVGFNSGSSFGVRDGKWALAARAGSSTMIASFAGGFTSIMLSLKRHKGTVCVCETVCGIVSALVAINSGCYMFSMFHSVIVGVIAAALNFTIAPLIDRIVDDAVGNIAIHFLNGAWGHLSVGFFADPVSGPKGLFIDGSLFQLKVQTISVICVSVWGAVSCLILIYMVDHVIPIRMDPEDEIQGSDLAEFGFGSAQGKELERPRTTFDKIFSIGTPIAQRFRGSLVPKSPNDFGNFGGCKRFSIHNIFEGVKDRKKKSC